MTRWTAETWAWWVCASHVALMLRAALESRGSPHSPYCSTGRRVGCCVMTRLGVLRSMTSKWPCLLLAHLCRRTSSSPWPWSSSSPWIQESSKYLWDVMDQSHICMTELDDWYSAVISCHNWQWIGRSKTTLQHNQPQQRFKEGSLHCMSTPLHI